MSFLKAPSVLLILFSINVNIIISKPKDEIKTTFFLYSILSVKRYIEKKIKKGNKLGLVPDIITREKARNKKYLTELLLFLIIFNHAYKKRETPKKAALSAKIPIA
jgi:hypothetical protein